MSDTQVDRIYRVTDTQVLGFFREHRFLSNFHICEIKWGSLYFSSTEAAYQACKCITEAERIPFTEMTPSEAKKAGQKVKLTPDWDDLKLTYMMQLNWYKYTMHPDLARLLLDTGDRELVEENWWGDKFYGRVNGVGENHLGKTLMQIRTKLRAGKHIEEAYSLSDTPGEMGASPLLDDDQPRV